MHIVAFLSLVFQITCVVHAIRNHNERWLYLIILLPGIGCAVYFFSEIFPQLRHSREAKQLKDGVVRAVDPQREIRRLRENLELSDTLQNRLALADACVNAGHLDDAIQLYSNCLATEINDPVIMEKLARTNFLKQQFNETKQILDQLIEHNPEYKSTDGHLLYARTLEALGDVEHAIREYSVLVKSYPGEEARCRFAILLKQQGHQHEAAKLFDEIFLRVKRSPKYYQKTQKQWVKIARENA